MASPSMIRFAAGIIGNITAYFVYLSPARRFIGICKKKTVEQYSPTPYLAAFVNCMVWVVYGMPFINPNSILVLTTNGAGFFIELVYLIIFVTYSNEKKRRLKIVLIAIFGMISVGVMTVLVLTFARTTKLRSSIVGMVASICNIMMYASPLTIMKTVIKTKSVEYMPLSLSIASLANGIAWSVYALRPFDPYIAVPNGIGTLFALVQLVLYATYYKSTKEQTARKAQSSEGLTEVVINGDSEKVAQSCHSGQAQNK